MALIWDGNNKTLCNEESNTLHKAASNISRINPHMKEKPEPCAHLETRLFLVSQVEKKKSPLKKHGSLQ